MLNSPLTQRRRSSVSQRPLSQPSPSPSGKSGQRNLAAGTSFHHASAGQQLPSSVEMGGGYEGKYTGTIGIRQSSRATHGFGSAFDISKNFSARGGGSRQSLTPQPRRASGSSPMHPFPGHQSGASMQRYVGDAEELRPSRLESLHGPKGLSSISPNVALKTGQIANRRASDGMIYSKDVQALASVAESFFSKADAQEMSRKREADRRRRALFLAGGVDSPTSEEGEEEDSHENATMEAQSARNSELQHRFSERVNWSNLSPILTNGLIQAGARSVLRHCLASTMGADANRRLDADRELIAFGRLDRRDRLQKEIERESILRSAVTRIEAFVKRVRPCRAWQNVLNSMLHRRRQGCVPTIFSLWKRASVTHGQTHLRVMRWSFVNLRQYSIRQTSARHKASTLKALWLTVFKLRHFRKWQALLRSINRARNFRMRRALHCWDRRVYTKQAVKWAKLEHGASLQRITLEALNTWQRYSKVIRLRALRHHSKDPPPLRVRPFGPGLDRMCDSIRKKDVQERKIFSLINKRIMPRVFTRLWDHMEWCRKKRFSLIVGWRVRARLSMVAWAKFAWCRAEMQITEGDTSSEGELSVESSLEPNNDGDSVPSSQEELLGSANIDFQPAEERPKSEDGSKVRQGLLQVEGLPKGFFTIGGEEANNRRRGFARRVGGLLNAEPLVRGFASGGDGSNASDSRQDIKSVTQEVMDQDEATIEYMGQFMTREERTKLWLRWKEAKRRRLLQMQWRYIQRDRSTVEGALLGMKDFIDDADGLQNLLTSSTKQARELVESTIDEAHSRDLQAWSAAKARVLELLNRFFENLDSVWTRVQRDHTQKVGRQAFQILSSVVLVRRLERAASRIRVSEFLGVMVYHSKLWNSVHVYYRTLLKRKVLRLWLVKMRETFVFVQPAVFVKAVRLRGILSHRSILNRWETGSDVRCSKTVPIGREMLTTSDSRILLLAQGFTRWSEAYSKEMALRRLLGARERTRSSFLLLRAFSAWKGVPVKNALMSRENIVAVRQGRNVTITQSHVISSVKCIKLAHCEAEFWRIRFFQRRNGSDALRRANRREAARIRETALSELRVVDLMSAFEAEVRARLAVETAALMEFLDMSLEAEGDSIAARAFKTSQPSEEIPERISPYQSPKASSVQSPTHENAVNGEPHAGEIEDVSGVGSSPPSGMLNLLSLRFPQELWARVSSNRKSAVLSRLLRAKHLASRIQHHGPDALQPAWMACAIARWWFNSNCAPLPRHIGEHTAAQQVLRDNRRAAKLGLKNRWEEIPVHVTPTNRSHGGSSIPTSVPGFKPEVDMERVQASGTVDFTAGTLAKKLDEWFLSAKIEAAELQAKMSP